jgi:hypothetical protein
VQAAKYWFAYLQRGPSISSILEGEIEKGIKWCEQVSSVGAGIKGDAPGQGAGGIPKSPALSLGGMEYQKDRPGMDYRHFVLPEPAPALCEKQCAMEQNCKAWTYVKPGIHQQNAMCWLKSGVPASRNNSCCVSGVK